jgi:hypothetical protein
MNAPEALQLLIHHMDRMWIHSDYRVSLSEEEQEQIKLATAICVAMLNTALPVSKYRAYVEVIGQHGAKKPITQGKVEAEYTACAVNMAGIRSGLVGLLREDLEVRVLVFEQKAGSADVVTGYHGFTKNQKFRLWFKELAALDKEPGATETMQ